MNDQDRSIINPSDPPESVRKWINRLRRTLRAAPKGIWLFNNGSMYIMADGPDGPVYDKYGSVDQDYIIASLDEILSEGGDF